MCPHKKILNGDILKIKKMPGVFLVVWIGKCYGESLYIIHYIIHISYLYSINFLMYFLINTL